MYVKNRIKIVGGFLLLIQSINLYLMPYYYAQHFTCHEASGVVIFSSGERRGQSSSPSEQTTRTTQSR